MIGIAQKVARNFSDAVRSRGQSYFVKGRVTCHGGAARRGRGQGARNLEIPGAVADARLEAAGLMHLPVFQSARGAVQAPLGDVAHGRGSGIVAVAAGVSRSVGAGKPAPLVDGWFAGGMRQRLGASIWRRRTRTFGPGDRMDRSGAAATGRTGAQSRGPQARGKDRGSTSRTCGRPGSWAQRGPRLATIVAGPGGRPKTKLPGSGHSRWPRCSAAQGRQPQCQAVACLRA